MPDTKTNTTAVGDTNRKPAKWMAMPMVVAGLLGGHVVFIMIAITLATGDRSFAVVPDYYQKAVAYDDHKAALAASAAMGWQVELTPADALGPVGERDVVLVLRDREGQPIAGAAVSVTGYHFARASEPVAFELAELLPGQYVGQAKIGREGFWRFEITAKQGETIFVDGFKQFVKQTEAR